MTPSGSTGPKKFRVERVAETRWSPESTDQPFGTSFSDHMLVVEFNDGRWGPPVIQPYGPLPLQPSITSLHYGISAFEGLKAHRAPDGGVLLFRPRDNARRFQRSAARLVMPEVPEPLFLEGIRELLRVDERWVPLSGSGALYIRPVLFSVDPRIGVKAAERFLFVVFTFPFGAYFGSPVDVFVTRRYVRAFPGGTGDTKPAGNYAAALLAELEARSQGCQSVLWLDGLERRYVEECGVMNVFFVLDDRVVTPELSGTILPGVTRESIITLLRDEGRKVEERRISIDEVVAAHGEGRLRESFGTGTAATVTHIRRIWCDDQDLVLPPVDERRIGPAIRDRLVAIMTGTAPDPHGWVERV